MGGRSHLGEPRAMSLCIRTKKAMQEARRRVARIESGALIAVDLALAPRYTQGMANVSDHAASADAADPLASLNDP
jgi:hypothetical protein